VDFKSNFYVLDTNEPKNKVKEGHCLNINHQHGDQNPRECFDGRKFHYSIYQKCIKSFSEFSSYRKRISRISITLTQEINQEIR